MVAIVAKISTSGKSACVMLKTSKHSMESIPVYVTNFGYAPKQELEFSDDLKIVDWKDHATKDGIPLKTLSK